MAVVIPIDCPQLIRNRCMIEHFGDIFCVVSLPFWCFVGVGDFVVGTLVLFAYRIDRNFLFKVNSYLLQILYSFPALKVES